MANIIHTCHVGFHGNFHPLKMSWVVVQNCPHVHLKRGPVTLSTHKDSRILKSHDLLSFVLTCPKCCYELQSVFEAGSHESQVLSPKSHVVNSCNLNH